MIFKGFVLNSFMENWWFQIKKFFRGFWNLLWKDDSWKGWLFSIVFLFIFIKFIFFPLLSLATGTALPLAIVESCSMYHDGNIFSNYNNWWERHDKKYTNLEITKEEFDNFGFKHGFNKGDILFIVGKKPEKIKIGDVIIFEGGYRNPIIHRVMSIRQEEGKYIFSTIGDNNPSQLPVEQTISEEQLVGTAFVRLVPYAGWIKLIFFEHKRSISERGFCDEN